jgi:hypothetical protein
MSRERMTYQKIQQILGMSPTRISVWKNRNQKEGKVDDAINCLAECTLKQAGNFCVYLKPCRLNVVLNQFKNY